MKERKIEKIIEEKGTPWEKERREIEEKMTTKAEMKHEEEFGLERKLLTGETVSEGVMEYCDKEIKEKYLQFTKDWFKHSSVGKKLREKGTFYEGLSDNQKLKMAKKYNAFDNLREKRDWRFINKDIENLAVLKTDFQREKGVPLLGSEYLFVNNANKKIRELEKNLKQAKTEEDEEKIKQKIDNLSELVEKVSEHITGRNLEEEAEKKVGPLKKRGEWVKGEVEKEKNELRTENYQKELEKFGYQVKFTEKEWRITQEKKEKKEIEKDLEEIKTLFGEEKGPGIYYGLEQLGYEIKSIIDNGKEKFDITDKKRGGKSEKEYVKTPRAGSHIIKFLEKKLTKVLENEAEEKNLEGEEKETFIKTELDIIKKGERETKPFEVFKTENKNNLNKEIKKIVEREVNSQEKAKLEKEIEEKEELVLPDEKENILEEERKRHFREIHYNNYIDQIKELMSDDKLFTGKEVKKLKELIKTRDPSINNIEFLEKTLINKKIKGEKRNEWDKENKKDLEKWKKEIEKEKNKVVKEIAQSPELAKGQIKRFTKELKRQELEAYEKGPVLRKAEANIEKEVKRIKDEGKETPFDPEKKGGIRTPEFLNDVWEYVKKIPTEKITSPKKRVKSLRKFLVERGVSKTSEEIGRIFIGDSETNRKEYKSFVRKRDKKGLFWRFLKILFPPLLGE